MTKKPDKEVAKTEYNIYNEIAKWPKGSSYTPDQILESLETYAITGNMKKTAELLNIPYNTIVHWKDNSPWWDSYIVGYRNAKNDELDAKQTLVLDKVHDVILDRLQDGDYVVSQGKVIRKPVTMKDAAVTGGITFEKRQLNRAKPTSIAAAGSDALDALAEKMIAKHDERMKTVIDVDKDDVQDV